jgi:hypothetical protein
MSRVVGGRIGIAAVLVLVAASACSGGGSSPSGPSAGPSSTSGDGRVVGRFLAVGGPLGTPGLPQRGRITFTAAGGQQMQVSVGASGRFSLSLPASTYVVTGRSPQYNGGHALCHALHPVRVRPEIATHLSIYCQRK